MMNFRFFYEGMLSKLLLAGWYCDRDGQEVVPKPRLGRARRHIRFAGLPVKPVEPVIKKDSIQMLTG